MDEKDIENSSEFENFEEKQEETQENNSMFSLGSDKITDGLEDFEGLFDEQTENAQTETTEEQTQEEPVEIEQELVEDIPEEVIEENIEEIAQDSFEEIPEEENKETIEKDFSEEFENSGFAEIFNNDSLSGNNDVDDFEEETPQQVPEVQNTQMTSDIIPDTSNDFSDVQEETQELITVRPVKFQQFENTPPNRSIKKNLDIMHDISMHVSVELGRTKSSIKEVMEMEIGSIVELEKIAGEQVEIFVNEKLVAKGEVIVIEDKFGVRVTSTNV